MASGNGELKLSWMTVVGAGTVVGLMAAAGWTIFQNEFANVKDAAAADRKQAAVYYNSNREDRIRLEADAKATYLTKAEHRAYLAGITSDLTAIRERIEAIQRIQNERASKLAHEPVEQKTIDAINSAIDKRIDLIQGQITDINRQIAAALIIIDTKKPIQAPP